MNGGICYDTYGSYICECPPNFAGFNCEKSTVPSIDQCISQPCEHGGTCINRKDAFQCICKKGFSGDTCENGPGCTKDCPMGTECIGGQCCEVDATGKQCKVLVADDCNCLNNGTCSENSSVCNCQEGWEGTLCEKRKSECDENCGEGICVDNQCYCKQG